jgi:hypothetical protein
MRLFKHPLRSHPRKTSALPLELLWILLMPFSYLLPVNRAVRRRSRFNQIKARSGMEDGPCRPNRGEIVTDHPGYVVIIRSKRSSNSRPEPVANLLRILLHSGFGAENRFRGCLRSFTLGRAVFRTFAASCPTGETRMITFFRA